MAGQREAGMINTGGARKETGFQNNPVLPAPTFAEAGIDKNAADRARKYAAIRRLRVVFQDAHFCRNYGETGVRPLNRTPFPFSATNSTPTSTSVRFMRAIVWV